MNGLRDADGHDAAQVGFSDVRVCNEKFFKAQQRVCQIRSKGISPKSRSGPTSSGICVGMVGLHHEIIKGLIALGAWYARLVNSYSLARQRYCCILD